MDKSLTTGQIAQILQVSPVTVLNWIRQRGLMAYRTPGGHYRVRPIDLEAFAAQYNLPLDRPSAGGLSPHD
jgi:excisionase family DNA binding protein